MRIGIYGNNLNIGYFFAREFAGRGHDAKLYYFHEEHAQDRPEWWLDEDVDRSLLIDFGADADVSKWHPLRASERIRQLYALASRCDVLLLLQDGPALFSELDHPNKVFLSVGGDLQNFPFALQQYLNIRTLRTFALDRPKQATAGRQSSRTSILGSGARAIQKHALRQWRQRKGLRQCRRWICAPNQESLIKRLKYDMASVAFLPFPYFGPVEFSPRDAALARSYAGYDVVFIHPTRQLFLPLDDNPYRKDNDKLIDGFDALIKDGTPRVRLLLVRKGRAADLDAMERMIEEKNLSEHVEWIDEIPNPKLRQYYLLENSVICDQYNSNLGYLGAIGREASCHGCPVITGFTPKNALYFGEDLPPHVYPALSAAEVEAAMRTYWKLSQDERRQLRLGARAWAKRQLTPESLIPRYLEVISA